MILIRVKGGLGNQMFQYALGRRLAIERGDELRFDLSWFNQRDMRQFDLDQFSIPVNIRQSSVFPDSLKFSNNRWVRKAGLIISKIPGMKRFSYLREEKPGIYDRSVLGVEGDLILDGYWQSCNYFEPIADLLREEFLPIRSMSNVDRKLADNIRKNPYSVSVHIRRGDYVDNYHTMAVHYVCTPNYYREAVSLLRDLVGSKLDLYVFSDDPEWARSEFGNEWEDCTIVSNELRKSAHEIFLMSHCSHHIISNSSFSWWGAWLGSNPNKKVISPKKWFRNQAAPDIVPEDWILLQPDERNSRKYFDIPYIRKRYFNTFKREINLDYPQAFNEKIQWLKLYDRRPMYPLLADKYEVREYVKKHVGEEYLNNLIGVYDSVHEIDYEKLPERFVLKATHGSGWNILCEDKRNLDIDSVNERMHHWLTLNYYSIGGEWVYKDIPPRIICEEYLDFPSSLLDYKIFCFSGKPRFIQVDVDRFSEHRRIFYNTDWVEQPFRLIYSKPKRSIQKPLKLDEMIEVARQLSSNIPFCRVDLYNPGDSVYFGEITFYPENGFGIFLPEEYDHILGRHICLPSIRGE